MNRIIPAILLSSFLGACASPSTNTPIVSDHPPSTGASAPGATSATRQATTPRLAPHQDPANALAKQRSVYFNVDEYIVGNAYRSVIQNHAQYLSHNPALKVRIEGNTDEQGSREYNLALGNKRSYAVKKALTSLGASEAQIEAISFGEEKPKASGGDQASWAENRRADIKYGSEQ